MLINLSFVIGLAIGAFLTFLAIYINKLVKPKLVKPKLVKPKLVKPKLVKPRSINMATYGNRLANDRNKPGSKEFVATMTDTVGDLITDIGIVDNTNTTEFKQVFSQIMQMMAPKLDKVEEN